MAAKNKKMQINVIFLIFILTLMSTPAGFLAASPDTPSDVTVNILSGFVDDSSTVVYFPLLENSGSFAIDLSGLSNHGTLHFANGVDWLHSGGLHFDGANNSLTINASESLKDNCKSVAIKFMWDGQSPDTELYLYDDGWANNGALIMYVHPATSRLYIEFMTLSGVHKTIWQPISLNTVYTAIFSFDGLTYTLWLNDKETSGSLQSSGTLQSRNIFIGSNYEKRRCYFSGDIYAVEIFNRYLNTSDLSILSRTFPEPSRVNPLTKYVLGGWVNGSNVQVYLNQTNSVWSDSSGVFRFVVDLPENVGNYTYVVTVSGNTVGAYKSIIVDRVLVSDCGSSSAAPGKEAVAWFKLVSEFDNEPMASGNVSLTDGLKAVWNVTESRWEYRKTQSVAGNLSLTVVSVVWDKYGLTTLSEKGDSHVLMTWNEIPIAWYIALLPWVRGVGPMLFGVAGVIVLLVLCVRLGFLKTEYDSSSAHCIRAEINELLESPDPNKKELILQLINRLLEENTSPELLKDLSNLLNQVREKKNITTDSR